MPIEIRELIIKSTFTEDRPSETRKESGEQLNQEQIIYACVEKVLEILKEKQER